MVWARFPLNGGAVNSRDPVALKPGEFAETSGYAYKPNDERLHNDLRFVTFGYFQPTDFAPTISNPIGPWFLHFEATAKDWLMMVASNDDGTGVILFAVEDGTTQWLNSTYTLSDNIGNRSGVSAASVSHWGDRYYLATDQGCVEIAPPTGTGAPTVTRLGLKTRGGSGATRRIIGDSIYGGFGEGLSYNTGGSDSDLTTGDYVSFVLTEYSTSSGVESAPAWVGGDPTTESLYFKCVAAGTYPTITLPSATENSEADSFRVYIKYWGSSTSVAETDVSRQANWLWRGIGSATGLSILYKGASDFSPGDVIDFDSIKKQLVNNPLPVLAADDGRLIYEAYRHPSCATASTVWNDSLVLNDAGYSEDLPDDTNVPVPDWRDVDAIPTIIRYSPPGEPWNQPVPYFMNFASESEDAIKGLRVVNDRLLVLCDRSIHTVRYLPFNNLLASQQGRVKDTVTTNVGLVSQRAHVTVETPRGEMCVWLSRRGLEWSDGTGWDDACADFKVPDGTTEAELSEAQLLVIPNEYRVDLYLGTSLYSFYYHPTHIKNGHLKMLGPTNLGKRVFGACEYGGVVYRYDGANVEWTKTAAGPADASAYTGFIYGANPFKDVVIEDLGLAHTGTDGTITLTVDSAVTGGALELGSSTTLPNPELEEIGSSGVAQRGNYVRFKFEVSGASSGWAVGPAWIKGDEESGGRG